LSPFFSPLTSHGDDFQLLRPEFANFLSKDEDNDIYDLIGRLIQTLSSPDIAIDDRHTPKLYARFLAVLLSKHRREGTIDVGRLEFNPPPSHSASSALRNQNDTRLGPTSSGSMFQVPHPQGAGNQGPGYSIDYISLRPEMNVGQVHIIDPTFLIGTTQFNFGSGPDNFSSFANGGMSDEEMLATMQALTNPAWWQNMTMPG